MKFRNPKSLLVYSSIALLLLASQLLAATKTWIGNAAAVPQIQTITIAGTWADTETHTCTINGKAITVTLVGSETTSTVATAIKEAWMAGSRLSGTSGSTDATSNAGGAQFGEFAEVTATVSGSVVTLTAEKPGKPFTVTVAETAAAGTTTLATVQACTGPNFWDNAKNWDTGTVPVNDDTTVFRDSDVSILYGLPNASLEVTPEEWMSFTGDIGLADINRDNPSLPYYEYRQKYARFDDAGTGTDTRARFGLGKEGSGSRLTRIKFSTLKASPMVFNTGTPKIAGTKALNICCTNNTSTLNILGGSVDFSSQDGSASAFVAVTQSGGDSRGVTAIHTVSAAVSINGGTALIGGAGAIATITTRGGTLRLENQSGTITTLQVFGGTVEYGSSATVTNCYVMGGTFDARAAGSGFTLTNGYITDKTSRFLDPFGFVTATNPIQLFFEPSADLQFGAGYGAAINITP